MYFHRLCSHTALYPQGSTNKDWRKPLSKALQAKTSFPACRAGFQVPKPLTEAEEKQKGHRSGWEDRGRCGNHATGRRAIWGRDSTPEPQTHIGRKLGERCWDSIPKARIGGVNLVLGQVEPTSEGNLCWREGGEGPPHRCTLQTEVPIFSPTRTTHLPT